MKKRSLFRIILNIAVLIAVLFLISWILSNNKKSNAAKTALAAETNDVVMVNTAAVVTEKLNLNFQSNGNFEPWRQLDFASENSGRVVKILVKEGSRVSPGQTLAVIDADLLHVDMDNARAALENAEKDQARYENAFHTGGVTQQQLDQVRLAVQNAKARVEQAKIRVGDANAKSSISGIVNKKYIEPGAYVNAGTALFELVDISHLKLVVNVNETQVIQLKTGEKVDIIASVYPDKTYNGTVTFIGNKADEALNFPVEIEVNNRSGELKAGMYATATFPVTNNQESIIVPRSAFAGSVSSGEVFVVKDSIATQRKVTAGRIMGDKVEILEGLASGEKVVTSGQINLENGIRVAEFNNNR